MGQWDYQKRIELTVYSRQNAHQ